MRKWLVTITAILSFVLPAAAIYFKASLHPSVQFLGDQLHAFILALVIWVIGLTLECWLDNNEILKLTVQIKQLLQTTERKAHISATSSENSMRLLNTITLRIRDYTGLIPINVGVANFNDFFIYLPFYVAREFDLFTQEDLAVHVASHGNDDAAFAALVKSEYQFAITDPGMITINPTEGRIIAPLVIKAALWGVSLRDPLDLSSIRSAVTYARPSTAFQIVEEWLRRHDITGVSIHERTTDEFVTQASDLLNTYDLVCITEPERSWLCHKYPVGRSQIDFHQDMYGHNNQFNFTSVLTTRREIEFNREVVKRFLKALRLAYNIVYSARQGTGVYDKIISAALDCCIRTYPGTLGREFDQLMCQEVFERLRSEEFFSKTVVYNSDQKRGLVQCLNLRQPRLDPEQYIVDADEAFGLSV